MSSLVTGHLKRILLLTCPTSHSHPRDASSCPTPTVNSATVCENGDGERLCVSSALRTSVHGCPKSNMVETNVSSE